MQYNVVKRIVIYSSLILVVFVGCVNLKIAEYRLRQNIIYSDYIYTYGSLRLYIIKSIKKAKESEFITYTTEFFDYLVKTVPHRMVNRYYDDLPYV